MKPFLHLLLTTAVGLMAAASMAGGSQTKVSFEKDVAPVLKRRCAICHITGKEPGLLSLVPARAYENLADVPSVQSELKRVQPGDPGASYLYHKISGTHFEVPGGEGDQMPLGLPPLPEEQLELIRTWIEQGAKNN